MADIGVYVRKEVLEHKQRDGKESDDRYCYYTFAKALKVDNVGKFWFASEGRWQGYFQIKRAIVLGEDEDGNITDLNDDSTGDIARFPDAIDENEPEIDEGTEVRFYSDSWIAFDGGPRKPFQGVTYNVPTIRRVE